jgi:hypothetical protein
MFHVEFLEFLHQNQDLVTKYETDPLELANIFIEKKTNCASKYTWNVQTKNSEKFDIQSSHNSGHIFTQPSF